MKKFMRFLGADPDEGTSGDFTGFVALIQQILLSLNLGWGAYLACAGPDPAGRRAFPVRDLRGLEFGQARRAQIPATLPPHSFNHTLHNKSCRKKEGIQAHEMLPNHAASPLHFLSSPNR